MDRVYKIGEMTYLPCGCVTRAEENGFTHFVNPTCKHDNKTHPQIKGYVYKAWGELQDCPSCAYKLAPVNGSPCMHCIVIDPINKFKNLEFKQEAI